MDTCIFIHALCLYNYSSPDQGLILIISKANRFIEHNQKFGEAVQSMCSRMRIQYIIEVDRNNYKKVGNLFKLSNSQFSYFQIVLIIILFKDSMKIKIDNIFTVIMAEYIPTLRNSNVNREN